MNTRLNQMELLSSLYVYVPFHIQAFEHKWEVSYSTSKFSSEIPHAILKIVFCLYCIYIFTVVHIQLSTHGFGLHKWIEIIYKSLTLHNISIALIYWLLPYTTGLLRQAVKLLAVVERHSCSYSPFFWLIVNIKGKRQHLCPHMTLVVSVKAHLGFLNII